MNNNDIINNTIKISGSIGMVKLVKDHKNIFIFYDDHSNMKYCNDSKSIFLYDLFDNIVENNNDCVILLEEPFINNYSNIKFLWNETPHIVKFRNFYKKIIKQSNNTKSCNVFPIDIRLLLFDVSIDELLENLDFDIYFDNYNINVFEYFRQILYLFDYVEWNNELFKNLDVNIKFVKKIFDKFKNEIYYIKLKEQFDNFYVTFVLTNKFLKINVFLKKYNNNIYNYFTGFPFENNDEISFLNQYDKLINGIMEFYAFILMNKMNYKNIILYSGYYHSNNLTFILKKYYGFVETYKIGNVNNIEKKNIISIKNCLIIDKKIFSNIYN